MVLVLEVVDDMDPVGVVIFGWTSVVIVRDFSSSMGAPGEVNVPRYHSKTWPFPANIVIATITGTSFWTHFGSGGPQYGSPLAQDLRLIRTRTEKIVG